MASKADIAAGAAFVRLFLKDDMTGALQKSLASVGKTLKETGTQVAKLGAGISAAGAAILAPITGAIMHFSNVGDALDKMSIRTGVSASALAALGFAAGQSGTDIEDVEKSIRRMQATIGDAEMGLSSATDALKTLGLSAADLKGMAPEDQFQLIADRLHAIEDPTAKAAAAMDIFGKSGTQLIPMLGDMRALREEARDLGLIPSEKAVKDAAAVNDALGRLTSMVSALAFEIGASLADEVLALAETAKKIIKTVQTWVKENIGLVKVVAAAGLALVGLGGIVTAVGGALIAAGLAASGLSVVVGALGTAFAFLVSPIGLTIAAVLTGVAAWAKFTESGQNTVATLKTALSEFFQFFQEVFGGIVDSLKSGDLALAGELAFLGLQLAAMEALIALQSLFGDTMTGIVGRILQGDIAGAWSATLAQLALLWEAFADMVTTTMTGMAESIVQSWQKVVTFIAAKILEVASLPGFNKMFEFVSGVDVKAEIERGQKMGVADPLGDAKKVAGEQVGAQASAMIDKLDAINKASRASLDAAAKDASDATKSGVDSLYDNLEKKRAEFNRKREEAAAKAATAAGAKAPTAAPGSEGGTAGAGVSAKNLITFSAASAVAAGYMGSGQSRAEDEIRKNTEKIAEEVKVAGLNTVKAIDALAASFVYGP